MSDYSSLIKFYSHLTKTALCDNIEKTTIHEPQVFVINSPNPIGGILFDFGQNFSYKKQVALDLSAREIFIQEENDNYVSVKYFCKNHPGVSFSSNFRAITQSEIFPFFVKAQILLYNYIHHPPIDINDETTFLNDMCVYTQMHIKFIFHKDILNVEPKQITFYEYDALLYTDTTLTKIREEFKKTEMFILEPFVFKNYMCFPLTMFYNDNYVWAMHDPLANIQGILRHLRKKLYLEELIASQKKINKKSGNKFFCFLNFLFTFFYC